MSKSDIEEQVRQAASQDQAEKEKAAGNPAGNFPIGTLLATLTLAGRDTMAEICPVFALRLRTSGGRKIADSLRDAMQGWDDSQ